MEENNEQYSSNGLSKCPYCPCCFCSKADLELHMKVYGASKLEHSENFHRAHGRIEHGSFSSLE